MKFIALKPARIVSLSGHCVHMEAEEERDLHGLLAQEAMRHPDVIPADHAEALVAAKQARVAAAETAAKEAEEAEEAEEDLDAAKAKELEAAVIELVARNNPDDFTTAGYPRVAAVMDVTGREDVSSTEIKEVFDNLGSNSKG